jgi:hypothetical protein
MKNKIKAEAIIKLLKKGYSPKEITERVAVSYNYAWKLKKDLEAEAKKVIAEAKEWVEEKIEPKPEPEVSGVDKVLDARVDQYGSFMQGADIAVRIKGIMHNAIARKDMHLFPDQLLALDMIAVKISRIVNGNASHRDSWLDIAGYAKLVADRLGGISR